MFSFDLKSGYHHIDIVFIWGHATLLQIILMAIFFLPLSLVNTPLNCNK